MYDGQAVPPPRTPCNPKLVLPPIYSSLQIINKDLPLTESEIRELEQVGDIVNCGEINCPIIVADGKQGLIHLSERLLPIKYDRIIKLTIYHYLCQEGTTWTLYCHNNSFLPVFTYPGTLTLEELLDELNNINAYLPRTRYDFDSLSRRLYKEPGDHQTCRYISEYRLYSGWQLIGTLAHDFNFYTERVMMNNDYQIAPYDKIYP